MIGNTNYLLEICCYSADDVLLAEEGGAHRAELCNGFSVGGTTPTLGCLQLAKSISNIPVFVMIRPRGGNFTYTTSEKKVMLKDAALNLENKADGLVFGALNEDGTLDEHFCEAMINCCGHMPLTFHRAIDICSNRSRAIEVLCKAGIQTILTSGGKQTALDGLEEIKIAHAQARGRIQIMAGSGVNADNVALFAKAGLNHFHSSASIIKQSGSLEHTIAFNASLKNNEIPVVSRTKVEAMVQQLNNLF